MNRHHFIELLNDNMLLQPSENDQLKEIVQTYPYFQSAQVMYFLSLLKNDNIHYHNRLKMASAYIGDRGILRQQVEKIKKKISFSVNQFDRSTLENQPAKSISGNDVDGTIKPSATDADNLKDVSTLDEIVNVESIIGVQDNSRLTGELTKTANQSKSKEELIDQFIENAPRIIRSKSDFFDPDEIAKSSQKDNEQIVSETLAQIYHKQGKTDKAIKIYRKLTVTNPEKSSYFAALIEKIISEQNLNT